MEMRKAIGYAQASSRAFFDEMAKCTPEEQAQAQAAGAFAAGVLRRAREVALERIASADQAGADLALAMAVAGGDEARAQAVRMRPKRRGETRAQHRGRVFR